MMYTAGHFLLTLHRLTALLFGLPCRQSASAVNRALKTAVVRYVCSTSPSSTQAGYLHICQASKVPLEAVQSACRPLKSPESALHDRSAIAGLPAHTRVFQNPYLGISVGQTVKGSLGCCCHIWGQGL